MGRREIPIDRPVTGFGADRDHAPDPCLDCASDCLLGGPPPGETDQVGMGIDQNHDA